MTNLELLKKRDYLEHCEICVEHLELVWNLLRVLQEHPTIGLGPFNIDKLADSVGLVWSNDDVYLNISISRKDKTVDFYYSDKNKTFLAEGALENRAVPSSS